MKNNSRAVKNIWLLTREYGDLAGAGGVKDVAAQLSRSLARWTGRRVSVVLPLYGFIEPEFHGFEKLADPFSPAEDLQFEVEMNYVGEERKEALQVWSSRLERVTIYLLESPRFHEKGDVYTYSFEDQEGDPNKRQGEGHLDYFAMNLLLQKGALQLILLLQEKPDIIHCHDGHTAVLPALIHEIPWLNSYFRATGFMVTVHNAGKGYHQEVADLPFAHAITGLPWPVIMKSRLNGSFDPLIAAGHYAVVNTVSENYARELQETTDDQLTGWFGHQLLDMGVKLEGVTNGIDPADFDVARGVELGLGFSFDPMDDQSMEGKRQIKNHLLHDLSRKGGIEAAEQYGWLEKGVDCPLFTFIGRLSEQKGVDILLAAIQLMVKRQSDFQVIVLGSGGVEIEEELIDITENKWGRGRVCFLCGYSPTLANRIYAAGDFFIIPSRYEPCGLTDFIAQLFGNLPLVHHVGGLVKVRDGETGFTYVDNSPFALAETMKRTIDAYAQPELVRTMQKQAVQRIEEKHTWKVVMQHYITLYKKAMNRKI